MSEQRQEQLSRIVIKGFKSIKDCDLELKSINVLIGSNGAGKSNFMSVFELFQNIMEQTLQLYGKKKGANTLFYNGIKVTDSILLEFHFGDTDSMSFEIGISENNSLFLYDKLIPLHDLLRVSEEFRDYSRHDAKEQDWRIYHFNDTSTTAKVKLTDRVSNAVMLKKDASNLAPFLFRLKMNYPDEYSNIIWTVQMIAPYFNGFVLEPEEENQELIMLRWQQKDCEDVFYASHLSDGTLRFICLATLLLQPSKIQPTTIIIDEPELGLHPFAITIFAELAKKAAVNKQIIISTQSVELLNNFAPEDVVVVDKNENGSDFKRIYDRISPEQLADWLDDYSLGELWNKNIFGGRFAR